MDVSESLRRSVLAELATLGMAPEDVVASPGQTLPRQSAAGSAIDGALGPVLEEGGERLRVRETIGEGGMGIVRLGTQVALDREVAIKSLRPDLRGPRPKARLLREAWITGRLEHPNIVPVHDIVERGPDDAQVVLKLIQGHAWSELVDDGAEVERRFGARDLLAWNLSILEAICNALSFAHSRGVLHRDVKPENVMIGEFGEVYLLDWGIAVGLRGDAGGRLPLASDAQRLAGTPAYMAPEMLGARPDEIGVSTDVYLLGATLFEIATGHPPHEADSFVEILQSIARSRPELPNSVPDELASIVRRAMRPDPSERFQSVEELRSALRDFVEHRNSLAIADEAARRAHAFFALIAEAEVDRPRADRLLSEARFGYRQALRAWPANVSANEGLARLIEGVVRHELAVGDPVAAERSMSELDAPPDALVAQVRAALTERDQSQRELHRRHKLLDASIGGRERLAFFGLVGGFFMLLPLLGYGLDFDGLGGTGHLIVLAMLSAALLGMAVVYRVLRDSVFSTLINRHTALGVVLMTIPQFPVHIGDWIAGEPVSVSLHRCFALWGGVVGLTAVLTSRWFVIASASYLVGYVIVALWPGLLYAALALCNGLVLGGLLAWLRNERRVPA